MNLLAILLLGIALSLDTFAVSLTLGLLADRTTHRQKVRFLVVIGLFHFLMIVIGWFMGAKYGQPADRRLRPLDRVRVAAVHRGQDDSGRVVGTRRLRCRAATCSRCARRMLLGIALSIDALITGFTIGLVQVRLFAGCQLGKTYWPRR